MISYLALITCIIVIDQLTKYLVVSYLKPIGSIAIIQDIFHFSYAENSGAAFSILRGQQTLLVTLTSLTMVFMLGYLYKWSLTEGQIYQKIAFAMIIGGGIANLIDRVRLNYVIDFIDIRAINFAIFNLADSFIVVGSSVFVILILFSVNR